MTYENIYHFTITVSVFVCVHNYYVTFCIYG